MSSYLEKQNILLKDLDNIKIDIKYHKDKLKEENKEIETRGRDITIKFRTDIIDDFKIKKNKLKLELKELELKDDNNQHKKSGVKYKDSKRIYLYREWNPENPSLTILMNTPSTADGLKNDEKRTIAIAKYNGYGSIKLYNIDDIKLIKNTTEVLIAWGGGKNKNLKIINKTESKVLVKKLESLSFKLKCFKKLKNGNPGLPTYLKKTTIIKEF